MTTVTHNVQTTLGAYLSAIPNALGHMDYEVRDNSVVAHSPDGTVVINLDYQGERKLGSLSLPMTSVEITCVGFSGDKAAKFLKHYDTVMLRCGGG